jgi:hypothetical protein
MTTTVDEQFLSLRNDIQAMTAEFKSLKAAMNPATITGLIATNYVAQFQSMEDRIVEKLSVKTKAVVKNTKIKSPNVECKVADVAKRIHCNYENMPHSSWTSYKIYFLQMKKLYPQHIEDILPADVWKKANENEAVVEINKTSNATPHQKAKAFVGAVWELGDDVSAQVIEILKADLIKEDNIRNSATIQHVSKEDESKEELDESN